jgi:hypothetical protein
MIEPSLIPPPGRLTIGSHLKTPYVVLPYYKMFLVVKADDGRNIGVSSERRIPPKPGERILIQERVGLLGTRSFVEIPSR